jgi:predicted dehydrogenase
MSDKIRFGIISFAHYHANFWAEAINDSPDADLAGIWDDNPARGREAAQKYGTVFQSDLNRLLNDCDAVGITTETSRHVEMVEAATAAGVHILLEKPMALNLAECKRITSAIQSAGVKFMQSFPKRYDPVNHELAELVHSGTLGKINLVRVRHANFHLLDMGKTAAEQWFADPAKSGGGSLLDEGIHGADLLLWLLGMPEQVFAMTSNATLNLTLDDTGIAIFRYPNGTLAEIISSGAMVAAEESIGVYGTEGSALLSGVDLASRDFSNVPYLRVYQRNQERGQWQGSGTTPQFVAGYFHQQGPLHFIKVLKNEVEPIVSLEDAWKSLAMIKAAYHAEQTGMVQPIPTSLTAK